MDLNKGSDGLSKGSDGLSEGSDGLSEGSDRSRKEKAILIHFFAKINVSIFFLPIFSMGWHGARFVAMKIWMK